MSSCKFPQHHRADSGRSGLPVVLAVAAVVVLAVIVRWAAAHWLWFAVPAVTVSMLTVGLAAVRFARLPAAARRYWLPARWAAIRWRWLARNLALAYIDAHRPATRPAPFGTSAPVELARGGRGRVRFPRARFRPDAHGITARVRTVPNVGRLEVEAAAEHIANAWRCVRVQVAQPRPGRLVVRGLRTDPLLEPFTAAQAPPGVYGTTSVHHPLRLYMGIDAWAQHRWISLPGCTGITIAGLPGRGKTTLVESWLTQLDPLPARFAIIDGKSSHLPTSDYADWADRAWILTGDDLEAAADALNEIYQEMRRRFAMVLELTGGKRNAWHVGPTEAMPLCLVVLDEVRTFFDMEAARGDKRAEGYVRACRSLAGHLVGKGRSVLMVTATLSQKQDSAATSLAVRDNSGIAISFAVRTVDAAVSALGADVREHPALSPVQLQADEYIGCCVASLKSGMVPYTMLRVPSPPARILDLPAVVPDSPAELVTS